jgi:hypothetical protein
VDKLSHHAGTIQGVPDTGTVTPEDLLDQWERGDVPDRAAVKASVKESLARLTAVAPGHAVEVRVPPYAAVQAIGGTRHRRGTPPAVVECDARTWIALATGRLSWDDAVASGAVRASGERSDLSEHLPLT